MCHGDSYTLLGRKILMGEFESMKGLFKKIS